MVEYQFFRHAGNFTGELILITGSLTFGEINLQIIDRDLFKLIVNHIDDGVPESEAGDQQSRTAADTHHHHGQALAVTENIPDGHLVQEADAVPEGQLFQEYLLSCIGSLGPDQLCRDFLQRPAAAIPGDKEHHRCIGKDNSAAEHQIKPKNNSVGNIKHDLIGLPEDRGEHDTANHNAQTASNNGAGACVDQILADDCPVAVAQSFQRTDLGPLFVDHPGHGGDADQGCNQQEECREHPGNTLDNIGCAVQRTVADVGVAVQKEHIHILHLRNLQKSVIKLCFAPCQLSFRIGKFLFCLRFALFIFDPALGKLDFTLFQLFPAFLQLFFSLGYLGTAGGQLLLTVDDLLLRIRHLGHQLT